MFVLDLPKTEYKDVFENIVILCPTIKKVSEYDQEIRQLQTADNPAPGKMAYEFKVVLKLVSVMQTLLPYAFAIA